MTENVRLQNLREFTVQIRNANDQIVGTGIAVSTDGKIVTCRHVVEAATKSKAIDGVEVGVYFPQLRGGEEKKRYATVAGYFDAHDDDVVLLQLSGGPSPLAPEQIAVLGTADLSERHPFQTYGYSPIGMYPASRGEGLILGSIEPPPDRTLQVDPIQLKCREIDAGMSGAAVLDVERNLVVGLIAERFYPKTSVKDETGIGVDSKVLTFDPFDFELRGAALALKPAPQFRLDEDLFKQTIEIARYALAHRPLIEKYFWNSAPSVLPEWAGRDELLTQLSADWNDPKKHVTGLIGFGGEGKSSLARKWVENLLTNDSLPLFLQKKGEPPGGGGWPGMGVDGVFWWGFYENRSVDEFLEAALKYLSGGRIDPRQIQSSGLRAQIIGKMLSAGRYLFVLDGLEVLQYQDNDQYGLLQNNNLRDLLTSFASPDHSSFCLITSRAPLLDLMAYTTYSHRDVERLLPADGRALLKQLGVKGADALLDKVVLDWDGHALTLGLLGSYVVEYKNGYVWHLTQGGEEGIPAPTANEPRYDRVHRVLRRYDEHLTEIEREFLKVFSAFRIPVHQNALKQVFKKLLDFSDNQSLGQTPSRLLVYGILRFNAVSSTYTIHPLIRAHYIAMLSSDIPDRIGLVHATIKKYYVAIARQRTDNSKLENLSPLLEAIHHACLSGDFAGAIRLLRKIEKGYDSILMSSLGAYDTYIELARAFFPDGDFLRESLVNPEYRKILYGDLGIAFSTQCSPNEAVRFHNAALAISKEKKKNIDICKDYENLSETYLYMGKFKESEQAALDAAYHAHRARNSEEEWGAFAYGAVAAYLMGALDVAEERFGLALKLLRKTQPEVPYLLDMWGAWQAQYLLRMNRTDEARAILMFNLGECADFPEVVSMLYSILGDCDSAAHQLENAIGNYDRSVQITRTISSQATLVEGLIRRGYFFARHAKNYEEAFIDLGEALHYLKLGECRWYEADIYLALAWAYLANGEAQKAKESATRALRMSETMGYYWGKLDAGEVLGKIENRE